MQWLDFSFFKTRLLLRTDQQKKYFVVIPATGGFNAKVKAFFLSAGFIDEGDRLVAEAIPALQRRLGSLKNVTRIDVDRLSIIEGAEYIDIEENQRENTKKINDTKGVANERISDEAGRPGTLGDAAPQSLPSDDRSGRAGRGAGSGSTIDEHRDGRIENAGSNGIGSVATGERAILDNQAERQLSEKIDLPDDYALSSEDELGKGTRGKKLHDNVAAIRLIKQLEKENRSPSTEESRVLVKFTGWGALKSVFNAASSVKQDRDTLAELVDLLTDNELYWARNGVLAQHFTAQDVIGATYSILEHFGFTGGNIIEPTVGVGNFIGLMPSSMRANSHWYATEIDPIPGNIAKHLYPRATILAGMPFQEAEFQYNKYDLVIGNTPFGDERISDNNSGRAEINHFKIHNYIISKSAMHLKVGGLMAMVVTHNFLDSKDDEARRFLAKNFNLVTAIRLPNDAFKENAGTSVTTDIVFFKKRDPSREMTSSSWLKHDGVFIASDGSEITLNEHFSNNPHLMLGTPQLQASHYGNNADGSERHELTLIPHKGLSIAKQINHLLDNELYFLKDSARSSGNNEDVDQLNRTDVPVGGFEREASGRIFMRDHDVSGNTNMVLVSHEMQWTEKTLLGEKRYARIDGMLQIRQAGYALIAAEKADASNIEALRLELNALYDTFVNAYGYINDPANASLIDGDVKIEFGLEKNYKSAVSNAKAKKRGGEAVYSIAEKADILVQRVFFPYYEPLFAKNAKDGYSISLSERGRFDLKYIETITGLPPKEIVRALSQDNPPLIFHDPQAKLWVQEDEYLSGNVKRKLRESMLAGRQYRRNTEALQKVQPERILSTAIFADIGQTWIPESVYEQFLTELGMKEHRVVISHELGTVTIVAAGDFFPASLSDTLINPDIEIKDMFNAMANKRAIVVYQGEGKDRRVHQQKTRDANLVAKKISLTFRDWVFADETRTLQLEDIYNETQNTTIDRRYDGRHLKMVGAAPSIIMRDTQKNAAWRQIQSNAVLLDHIVGAGKTYTLIAGIMERVRLGLSKKPLLVVPNHLIAQWAQDFIKLYPGANILAATEKDFQQKNRRRLFANIGTSHYDAIIIGHSSLKFIPLSKEREMGYLRSETIALERAASEAKNRDDKRSVRTIANRIAKRREKLKSLNKSAKDNVLSMEDMGIDYLAVDECFPYDIPVKTDEGWLQIGEIVENQLEVSVLTCNLLTGELEWKKIVRWIPVVRNKTMVKITHEHGHFTCTFDHKIWTKNGYIKAGELSEKDYLQILPNAVLEDCKEYSKMRTMQHDNKVVRTMQKGVFIQDGRDSKRQQTSVLHEHMRGDMEEHTTWSYRSIQQEPKGNSWRSIEGPEISGNINSHEREQPDVKSEYCGENEAIVTRPNLSIKRGELKNNETPTNVKRYYLSGNGVRNNDGFRGKSSICKSSKSLQGRYSFAKPQISNRGRWKQSQNEEMEVFGQEENRGFEFSRVESVKILERGYSGEPTENSGHYQTVYDIEVEDNHNFFAAGVLVSNCHEFKNLEYASGIKRVAGMGNPNGSQKAFDLYMKLRYIKEINGGIAFATGTPISNSLVEMYSVMRYLNDDGLEDRRLSSFDAWIKNYALIESKIEYTATQQLKERTVMSNFNNIPEMMQLYSSFGDIVTMSHLTSTYAEQIRLHNALTGEALHERFPVPKIIGGERLLRVAQPSDGQKMYMDYLIERTLKIDEDMKTGKFDPTIDNLIWVYGDAKKAALDLRTVDPLAEDDANNKTSVAAAIIIDKYREWDTDKGTQLVFCDLSTPSKSAKKNAEKLFKELLSRLKLQEDSLLLSILSPMSFQDKWLHVKPLITGELEGDILDARRDLLETLMFNMENDIGVLITADTGFSVYDDLKKKLILLGIPANEIQFIHDYDKAKDKKDLFDQVNSGNVRVLIGSTAKMGAGTNAQERLVGVVHIDASMHNRPADIEQREGRILRQGNKLYERDPEHFKVAITAISTAGTFDTVSWQILARKAAMLEGFRSGLRTIDEGHSDSASYMEFMAETTGNPIFREKIQLEGQIEELESNERRIRSQRSSAKHLIATSDRRFSELTDNLAKRVEAIRLINEVKTYTFRYTNYQRDGDVVTREEAALYNEEKLIYNEMIAEFIIKKTTWDTASKESRGPAPKKPVAPEPPTFDSKRLDRSEEVQFLRAIKSYLQAENAPDHTSFYAGNLLFNIAKIQRNGVADKTDHKFNISDESHIIYCNMFTEVSINGLVNRLRDCTQPKLFYEEKAAVETGINKHTAAVNSARRLTGTDSTNDQSELDAKKERYAEIAEIVNEIEDMERQRRLSSDNRYIISDRKRFPDAMRDNEENSAGETGDHEAITITRELTQAAEKQGLAIEDLCAFVNAVMYRMIFDGEKLTDLFAPLELNWKARAIKEGELMADLVPLLKKLANGGEISGLTPYDAYNDAAETDIVEPLAPINR